MDEKRKKITMMLLAITGAYSLFLGIADSLEITRKLCSEACVAVHGSSFGTLLGIPLAYWGAVGIFGILLLKIKKHDHHAFIATMAMVGGESYFTLIQLHEIQQLCSTCILFFILVSWCAVLMWEGRNTKMVAYGTMATAFLAAHFFLFPPGVDMKNNLVRIAPVVEARPQVEIFASPSCAHCEEAINNLKQLCQTSQIDLVVKPVGLDSADRRKSIQWVCKTLFETQSASAEKIAENIVQKNEKEAKSFNAGELAVPIIVIKTEAGGDVFRGWDKTTSKRILSALSDWNTQWEIPKFKESFGLPQTKCGDGSKSTAVCSSASM